MPESAGRSKVYSKPEGMASHQARLDFSLLQKAALEAPAPVPVPACQPLVGTLHDGLVDGDCLGMHPAAPSLIFPQVGVHYYF